MIEMSRTRIKRARGMRYREVAAIGVATLGIALGCESQADPSYRGEPLMSVAGQVEAALRVGEVEVGILWLTTSGDFDLLCTGEVETANGEPSECVAACGEITCATLEAWGECVEGCGDVTGVSLLADTPPEFVTGGIGQTTPAVGEFPAQFSLEILQPPPDSALIGSSTGERLAVGLFVALDPAGAPFQLDADQSELPDWLLGSSVSHALVFSPDGIPESSVWFTALGLTMAPGYQLMQLPTECEPSDEECDAGLALQPAPDASAAQVNLRIGPPIALPLLAP